MGRMHMLFSKVHRLVEERFRQCRDLRMNCCATGVLVGRRKSQQLMKPCENSIYQPFAARGVRSEKAFHWCRRWRGTVESMRRQR